ncbi:MAG: tRNA lysidine(34) synthetase TilS, partial [Bacilli bacterium]|nr:tRNA lysidine(34) synthetase TilS [Bacilli bacterium]
EEKIMEQIVTTFLEDNNINLQGEKIVLAVSTGIDSMVLLHIFMKLAKKQNFSIIVAHVNHHKRLQSQQEEKFIRSFCLDNGLLCYIKNLDFSATSENFQAEARKRRYEFFQEILEQEKAQYLVLAHHGNDVLETIMMRLLRGSSLSGYAGMKAIIPFKNHTILRPLLTILKSDIEKYQQENQILYYEDQSNAEDIYTRNRLRKEIVPALMREDQQVHLKFLEFSQTLHDASMELNKIRDEFIEKKVSFALDGVSFHNADFKKLSLYMQAEVLYELLKSYHLGKANIVELLKLVNSKKANNEVLYKKDLTFVKEYNKIYFFFKELMNEDIYIVLDEIKKYKVNDTITINVTKKTAENITNNNCLCYNSNYFPLVVRSRKQADKIKLSQGYKKVKDLLIDEKIGILQRKKVLILEDSSQEILAVLGIKKSEILKEIKEKDIIISMEENINGQSY